MFCPVLHERSKLFFKTFICIQLTLEEYGSISRLQELIKLSSGIINNRSSFSGIEICERLSTMGIAVNLVTYLGGTMHLPSATSANVVTDFMGTSFLLCLLGGFLADSYLGRYRTIAIFAFVQMLVSTEVTQFSSHLAIFKLSFN